MMIAPTARSKENRRLLERYRLSLCRADSRPQTQVQQLARRFESRGVYERRQHGDPGRLIETGRYFLVGVHCSSIEPEVTYKQISANTYKMWA